MKYILLLSFVLLGRVSTDGLNTACWVSQLDTSGNSSKSAESNIEQLNIEFINRIVIDKESLAMLPLCFSDAQFSVTTTPTQTPFGDTLYSGEEADFQIQLNASLSEIVKTWSAEERSSVSADVTVWFRVLACNIKEVPFCHPFVDISQWDAIGTTRNPGVISTFSQQVDGDSTMTTSWLQANRSSASWDESTLRYQGIDNITAIVPLNEGASYEFLGHIAMYIQTGESYYRVDVSTSLVNVVRVEDESARPEIKFVSKSAKIIIGLIIGVCGSIMLFYFGVIAYFRNHRVMTMAQAGLLGWLTACSLFTVLLAFLIMPTREGFCQYSGIALIPASMSTDILIGRLFRVYSTLGKASRFGRSTSSHSGLSKGLHARSRKAEERLMSVFSLIAFSRFFHEKDKKRRSTTSIRQATTRNDTVRLILVLSIPQTALQLFRVAYYDSGLVLQYDDDYLIGRQVCDDSDVRWVKYTGMAMLVLHYILCVYVAWCSRELPAAFNESSQIFKTAITNACFSVAMVLLQVFFDLPTTSPSVSSVVKVIMLVSLPMTITWFMVVPKVKKVLNGETVVVSNLLREMATFPVTVAHSDSDYVPRLQAATRPNAAESNDRPHALEVRNVSEGMTSHTVRFEDESEKIVLKEDDPLPLEVECKLHELEAVLSSLKTKSLSGRPIRADELWTLKQMTSSLSTEMDMIVYEGGQSSVAMKDEESSRNGSLEQDSEKPDSTSKADGDETQR